MNDYAGPERARFLNEDSERSARMIAVAMLLCADGLIWLCIGIAIGWWIWA